VDRPATVPVTAAGGAIARRRWLVAATEYGGLTQYTGGIGRHYAALLPALVRCGIDVDLLVFADAPPREGVRLDGVRLVGFQRTDRMPRTRALLARARRVREQYDSGRYDCVFLPEWAGLGAALPNNAPLLTNLATSAQLANAVSGLRVRDLPIGSRLSVTMQIHRETHQIRRSAGLIPISHAMLARTASSLGDIPPAIVVRNCIEVERVASLSRTSSAPPEWPHGDEPVVLFLGRAERRKGVIEAVAAFGLLHERMPRARLVLAGAGGDARFEPTRSDLLASLPTAARRRVTWLGHVRGGELYRAIREADVVMCPSRWEGFGNVALEVKAIGTPLIVTSGSGFDDFCIDGYDCLMVPPADPGQLARALERSLVSPSLTTDMVNHALSGIDAFAPDPVAADLLVAAQRLLG
jgi:glycogen synthase